MKWILAIACFAFFAVSAEAGPFGLFGRGAGSCGAAGAADASCGAQTTVRVRVFSSVGRGGCGPLRRILRRC